MLIGLILLALALTELWLGLYFIFRYEKAQSTIWYGLFFIGASIYVGMNGLGYIPGFVYSNIAERISWAGGTIATTFFFAFSFSYPISYKRVSELIPWILWPVAIFVPSFIFTDLFVKTQGIISLSKGYVIDAGPYLWFFVIFLLIYWFWSITNLINHYKVSDGIHRWLLRMVLLGVSTSLIVTLVFDIAIPLIRPSNFGYVGSLFTSVWVLFTGYILVAKR